MFVLDHEAIKKKQPLPGFLTMRKQPPYMILFFC